MASLPIAVKHFKVSYKADGQDPSLLQPSDWNKDHVFRVDAKSLVGNVTDSPGDATSVPLSDEFKFEDGKLSLGSNFEDAEVVVSVDTDDFPGARVLTATPTVAWDFATAKQAKANIPDNGVTLAKMELSPTGSEILYYDKTSKAPVRLPAGTAGMVLKSGNVAVVGPPVVDATNPSWGFTGAPHAVYRDQKANGVAGGTTTAAWVDRVINHKLYDTYDFVTLAANVFTLGIGTWVIEWSCPARECQMHQTRLFNNTDTAHPVVYGSSEYSDLDNPTQSRSTGVAQVVTTVATGSKFNIVCVAGGSLGVASNFDSCSCYRYREVYTIVKSGEWFDVIRTTQQTVIMAHPQVPVPGLPLRMTQ